VILVGTMVGKMAQIGIKPGKIPEIGVSITGLMHVEGRSLEVELVGER